MMHLPEDNRCLLRLEEFCVSLHFLLFSSPLSPSSFCFTILLHVNWKQKEGKLSPVETHTLVQQETQRSLSVGLTFRCLTKRPLAQIVGINAI